MTYRTSGTRTSRSVKAQSRRRHEPGRPPHHHHVCCAAAGALTATTAANGASKPIQTFLAASIARLPVCYPEAINRADDLSIDANASVLLGRYAWQSLTFKK
jgi:hypothetical protein